MPATILIVENHVAVRKALRDWLQAEFPQFRILAVASGEEAMALARNEPPRLIVMEVRLAGMNGIETARQIKAVWPVAQIVMLTIYADDIYCAEARAAGASACVTKQRMHSELVPALVALLAACPA